MSNSYNNVSIKAIDILYDLYESEIGALVILDFNDYTGMAIEALVKRGLIEKLTKTKAYQITPLGIYVYGLINEKTKEVLNDTN